MKKQVVYETQWVARNKEKEYPHGWGFDAPIVMFSQDQDPVWCADYCKRYLSDEEFECIGAIPRQLLIPTTDAQSYTRQEVVQIIDDLLTHADAVVDAVQSEDPKMDAGELLKMVEEWNRKQIVDWR